MGAEVQASPSHDLERLRIDLDQPAGVVSDPDRALAEGDALRAAQAGEVADHVVGGRIELGHRTAAVALVIVASPDKASSEGDHRPEIDRTRRDPRADPARAHVDPDQAAVELGCPHRAGAHG
jgi:hypothetical protein